MDFLKHYPDGVQLQIALNQVEVFLQYVREMVEDRLTNTSIFFFGSDYPTATILNYYQREAIRHNLFVRQFNNKGHNQIIISNPKTWELAIVEVLPASSAETLLAVGEGSATVFLVAIGQLR